jgi:DNA-directed RNA polymerase II subunit RPB1
MTSTAKLYLIIFFSQRRPLLHIARHHLNGLPQALPRMERLEAIHTSRTLPGIEITFGESTRLVFYVVNMRHIYLYYAHSCRIIHPSIPKSLVDFFVFCLSTSVNTCLCFVGRGSIRHFVM